MPPKFSASRGNPAGGSVLSVTPAGAFPSESRRVEAETLPATVLFVDLRGYTALAEQLAPADVVGLLDEFFGVLAGATATHDGQIFYMVGDGMMAGFGLNSSAEEGARGALAAAQAMLRFCAPILERWRRDFAIDTGLGIGLHVGDVAIGFHGPPGQRIRTLVGDTVNVAARLCSRARAGEVLFSSTVASAIAPSGFAEASQEAAGFVRLPQFALRGRSRPLDIWCLPAGHRLII